MRSAPGYKKFENFCSEVSECDDEIALTSHLILDDDDNIGPHNGLHDVNTHAPPTSTQSETVHVIPPEEHDAKTTRNINYEGLTSQREEPIVLDGTDSVPEIAEPTNITDQGLLLRWHVRLGQLSFQRLKCLAIQGYLPKKLAKVEIPICLACKYGKATKKPWRTKAQPNTIVTRTVTAPGDCVSVDQMTSSTPGFVAQMIGSLTKATIFVDHFSRLCYVYPQKTMSAAETLEAKHSFESFAATHKIKISNYHADNGRFDEKASVTAASRPTFKTV